MNTNVKKILDEMPKEDILLKLKEDEHYYGDFGNNFLSNSSIYTLINNPKEFRKPNEPNINLLFGAAFHTMILEPEKMEQYKIIDATSRYTNKYKTESKGVLTLLTGDLDKLKGMKETLDSNDLIRDILQGDHVDYEIPAYTEINGEIWKGKADAINHRDRLIIDVKTTSDITKFHLSAKRYNYDSQAYIYNQLFGYDMVFVVIDKKTNQVGFFDCSQNFYQTGKEKLVEATFAYRMYFKDEEKEYDWKNYLITESL